MRGGGARRMPTAHVLLAAREQLLAAHHGFLRLQQAF
jgi:hypothetical protein